MADSDTNDTPHAIELHLVEAHALAAKLCLLGERLDRIVFTD